VLLGQGLTAVAAATAAAALPLAPAFADGLEDLSADDAPAEPKKVSTDEERIKRKLEAQARATGKGASGRQTYQVCARDLRWR
jgi:hypothetical protein